MGSWSRDPGVELQSCFFKTPEIDFIGIFV